MTDKHTPGPWSVTRRPDGTMVVLARNADGNPRKHIAEMAWSDSEGGEPDARLIAACPTMHDYIEKRAAEGCQEATAILEAIHDL